MHAKPTGKYQTKKPRRSALPLVLLALLVAGGVALIRNADRSRREADERTAPNTYGTPAASPSSAEAALDTDTETALETAAESNSSVRKILEQREKYPTSLLQLLSRNAETLDFVSGYPKHKNDAPAKTVGRVKKGEIPLLLQWDERWGYTIYGSDFLAVTGCGPTCISMVAAGLTGDNTVTPRVVADYAEENGYYAAGAGSTWTLMTEGCTEFGLASRELPLDEATIRQELEAGHPIVCSMLPGDFTTAGHFLVLTGVEDGKFRLNDPNSELRSEQLWDYDTLSTQIGNLWAFWAE